MCIRDRYYKQGNENLFEASKREAKNVRQNVGVCDVTTLGKIDIKGPDSAEFLNRVYSYSLLFSLGWPNEQDFYRARRAAFRDLVELPKARTWLSTVSLEDDTVVTPSVLLEEIHDLEIEEVKTEIDSEVRVTYETALAYQTVLPEDLPEPTSTWLAVRQLDCDWSAPRYHGFVGSWQAETYGVRSLEDYQECPFKYFADSVLGLGLSLIHI